MPASSESSEQRVGPDRLIERIGHGDVYRAEDGGATDCFTVLRLG
jgi:hypothetical protein